MKKSINKVRVLINKRIESKEVLYEEGLFRIECIEHEGKIYYIKPTNIPELFTIALEKGKSRKKLSVPSIKSPDYNLSDLNEEQAKEKGTVFFKVWKEYTEKRV